MEDGKFQPIRAALVPSLGDWRRAQQFTRIAHFWNDNLNLIVYNTTQPITYSGDQVVTQTAINTKNPWLQYERNFQ